MKEENEGRPMGQVIKIDEARIRDHLGEMVRGTVEETLNAMLDADADELCGAGRPLWQGSWSAVNNPPSRDLKSVRAG